MAENRTRQPNVRLVVALAGLLALLSLLLAAPGASAAFPGENGRIVFTASHTYSEPCPAGSDYQAYLVHDDGIFTMNPDGSDARQVLYRQISDSNDCYFQVKPGHDRRRFGAPTFSPNSNRIAYSFSRHAGIFIVGADGSDDHPVAARGSGAYFSPNGKRIVFSGRCGTAQRFNSVCTAWRDGTHQRRITPLGFDPTFFPGGNTVAFVREDPDSGRWDCFTIRTDGSDLQRLARGCLSPDVSPNGNRIVFQRQLEPANYFLYDVFLMRADGTRKRRLTYAGERESNSAPVFSPDGRWIAFQHTTTPTCCGSSQIIVMRPSGSDQQAVVPDPLPYGVSDPTEVLLGEPSWGPAP
jgi:hypothetical protein